MNWIGIISTLLTIINVIVCVLLIFIVLLQRPKNEGLGAAFGGETASNIFGAQTTNVLAYVTRWLGGIFLILCFTIAILGSVNPTRKTWITGHLEKVKSEKAAAEAQKKVDEEAQKAADAAKATEMKAKGLNSDGTPIEKPAAVTPAVPTPGAPNSTPIEKPSTPPADAKPEAGKPAAPEAPKPPAPAATAPGSAPAPAAPSKAPESAPKPPAPTEAPKPAEAAKPAPAPAPAEAPKAN